MLKHFLKLVVPVIVLALSLTYSAHAQVDGYRFGVGLGYSGFDGNRFDNRFQRNFFGIPIAPTPRIDQPPFFALYPPVYYSQDIIPRPYGVSPFAAPPGINPVEMGGAYPMHQVNPYYVEPNVEPNPDGQLPPKEDNGAKKDNAQKTTWIKNPHFDPLADVGNVIAAR